MAISVMSGAGIQSLDRTPERIRSTARSGAAMKPIRRPNEAHLESVVMCSVRSGANVAIAGMRSSAIAT